jgi:hypothetical protein
MHPTQSQFRAALLDPCAPVPEGVQDARGAPAGRRFAVYRNTVTVSLVEAMKIAFPAVRRLLGPQNFDTLMPVFVRAHPPESPLMMHYGTAFPAFLAGFAPLAHLGFLADVARLDLALRTSYHAADARPFDAQILQQPPEKLAMLHLARAPATLVLRSAWPVFDLWKHAAQGGTAPADGPGQAVLVTRPLFDPQVHLLPHGAATWLDALEELPLGAAIERAVFRAPGFDFGAALGLALRAQAFCDAGPQI